MAKFGIAPGPSGSRRRIATAFAAAGALLLSSGLVVAAAAPAVANHGSPHNQGNGNPDNGNPDNGNQDNGKGKGKGGKGTNPGGGNSGGGNSGTEKFYVCKWVGQPDVGDAAHHIVPVSGSPIEEEGWFNDKQGASYVLPSGVSPILDNCPGFGEDGGEDGADATLALKWAPNDCVTDGFVDEPTAANIEYSITDGSWDVKTGMYTVTAQLRNGVTAFTGSTEGWTVDEATGTATRVIDLGEDQVCADLTASAVPIDECGEWGSVTATDTALVDYSVPGDRWNGLQGDVVVTATLQGGATAFTSTSGWTGTGSSVSRTFELGSYIKCSKKDDDPKDKLVTPLRPSATDATCSRDGRLVVPNQPNGVQVQRSGSVPGDVTFTFSPAEGYAFPAGTRTKVTVTVPAQLEGDDCILGVDTNLPKPGAKDPGSGPAAAPANNGTDAEVLGEQAVAVPTAVAAGLGDTMTATSTTSRPLLAQALVAAGLLMLVAGGATGLGRRTRGAHES